MAITAYIFVFVHRRLGRRKHASKQTTRKIENKQRKNTYLVLYAYIFIFIHQARSNIEQL